jgi:hypothetical protein
MHHKAEMLQLWFQIGSKEYQITVLLPSHQMAKSKFAYMSQHVHV